MIAAWKGKISDENTYNHERQKWGDSTIPRAQLDTLAHWGITAQFSATGTRAQLVKLLEAGIPVGCGILHHGQPSSPWGGGHWMLAIGFNDHGIQVHDPYGELNCFSGDWATIGGTAGEHLTYSWKNWLPRWEVTGGDGFMLWAP
jgi:hypothetical protein